jgi:hypothetical protein
MRFARASSASPPDRRRWLAPWTWSIGTVQLHGWRGRSNPRMTPGERSLMNEAFRLPRCCRRLLSDASRLKSPDLPSLIFARTARRLRVVSLAQFPG